MSDLTGREEVAMRVLQGFCANPSVFAYNGQFGWGLVNCTDKQLVDYAFRLADEMVCTVRPIKPTAESSTAPTGEAK